MSEMKNTRNVAIRQNPVISRVYFFLRDTYERQYISCNCCQTLGQMSIRKSKLLQHFLPRRFYTSLEREGERKRERERDCINLSCV